MESGHSHIEVDRAHSVTERLKKTGVISAPSQWYTAARMARRARLYHVKEMQTSDFLNFKNINYNNNNPICKAPECQKTSVALADRSSRAN